MIMKVFDVKNLHYHVLDYFYGFIAGKMTRVSKVWKMAIFKHFVDEIEIDKITNTAKIFPFVAKFVFLWTLERSFWINCMEVSYQLYSFHLNWNESKDARGYPLTSTTLNSRLLPFYRWQKKNYKFCNN